MELQNRCRALRLVLDFEKTPFWDNVFAKSSITLAEFRPEGGPKLDQARKNLESRRGHFGGNHFLRRRRKPRPMFNAGFENPRSQKMIKNDSEAEKF